MLDESLRRRKRLPSSSALIASGGVIRPASRKCDIEIGLSLFGQDAQQNEETAAKIIEENHRLLISARDKCVSGPKSTDLRRDCAINSLSCLRASSVLPWLRDKVCKHQRRTMKMTAKTVRAVDVRWPHMTNRVLRASAAPVPSLASSIPRHFYFKAAPVAQLLNARARHQTHLAARSSMLGSVIARALRALSCLN